MPVTLTDEGAHRAEQFFATKTEAEHRMFAVLPPDRQRAINGDLRAVLLAVEGS